MCEAHVRTKMSKSLKMNVCIVTYFICFTIVLLPDSPAPVGRLKQGLKMEFRLESITKEPAATEQNNREEGKKVNIRWCSSDYKKKIQLLS